MNNDLFYYFYSLSHKSIFFDKFIVFVAEWGSFIFLFIVAVFFIFRNKNVILPKKNLSEFKLAEIVKVFFGGVIALSLSRVLKIIFDVARPFERFNDVLPLVSETRNSFPSSHATVFAALAFSVFFINKKVGTYLLVLTFLIGISRIIVGVHFPLDILGGFVFGYLIAYFIKKI